MPSITLRSARVRQNSFIKFWGYRPEKLILYGSAVTGKVTSDSDIDFLVIKDTKKNAWERLKEVDRYIEHTVPVDVLVYTPGEIKKRLSLGDFFIKEGYDVLFLDVV